MKIWKIKFAHGRFCVQAILLHCWLRFTKTKYSNLSSYSYENKYVKFFKSKPSLPPGLSHTDPPANKMQQSTKPETDSTLSKTAKRNLKRKEKRKQEKGDREPVEEARQELEKVNISETADEKDKMANENPAAEKVKKLKNLRKKLRQVEELQQKIDCGEIKQPSKEQLEKLARRKAVEEEIEDLELDL